MWERMVMIWNEHQGCYLVNDLLIWSIYLRKYLKLKEKMNYR